jgi:hypothetical protein
MKIYDKNNNLLAIIIREKEIPDGRNFITGDEEEMQLASFNYKKETIIDNHLHLEQKRNIQTTSEVIFLISGEIKAVIFAFLRGGHGLVVKKGSKFIESKQGPYVEAIDKIRF